ncbi:MAG: hypothetical protein AAGG68_27240 [Bacteroidota bacterium]
MRGQKKRVKSRNRYSNSLKRKIAKSYLSGEASYGVLAEEHGLRDKSVVKEFVKWYRRKLSEEPNFEDQQQESVLMKESKEENLSASDLQARVNELEQQLKRSELKTELLETMIDIAEAQFNVEIRKKSGTNQSKQ